MKDKLWVEKYRPTKIADYVFQNVDIEASVRKWVADKDIPHLLITGVQGTGKTTIAKVLINELGIDRIDVLTINASKENGIDGVRERITNFCMSYPMGSFKIVLLEEADGLSMPAQKALRATIEDFSDTVRFMFTANYPHKIIPALHSRTQHIEISAFEHEALLDRVAYILEQEGVAVENDEYVFNHIEKYSPDLRKIIQSIQQSSATGVLRDVIAGGSEDDFMTQWEELWSDTPNFNQLMKVVGGVDETNFERAFEVMYNNVERMGEDYLSAIPIIAEYLYRGYAVTNHEILMSACLIRIFNKVEV